MGYIRYIRYRLFDYLYKKYSDDKLFFLRKEIYRCR